MEYIVITTFFTLCFCGRLVYQNHKLQKGVEHWRGLYNQAMSVPWKEERLTKLSARNAQLEADNMNLAEVRSTWEKMAIAMLSFIKQHGLKDQWQAYLELKVGGKDDNH